MVLYIFVGLILLGAMLGGNKESITVQVEGNGEPFAGWVLVVDGPPDNRVYHPLESFSRIYSDYGNLFSGENIMVEANVWRDENALPGKKLTISLWGKDGRTIDSASTLGYEAISVSNGPQYS